MLKLECQEMLDLKQETAVEAAKDFGVEVKDFNAIIIRRGESIKMDKKRLTENWNL